MKIGAAHSKLYYQSARSETFTFDPDLNILRAIAIESYLAFFSE
jgi:hypothetical protein